MNNLPQTTPLTEPAPPESALPESALPENADIAAWVKWAHETNEICQTQEQTRGCLAQFNARAFSRAMEFLLRPSSTNAYVECGLVFVAMISLRHTCNTLHPSETNKIPLGDFAQRQRAFFIAWLSEGESLSNEASLLLELAELCRIIAPNTWWDDYQYIANVPAMESINSKIDNAIPLDRSSVAAFFESVKKRKLASDAGAGAVERRFYCGIDSRTLRWQAGWWIDFWKMRQFDEQLTAGARVYSPPEVCTYSNHWFLASLREIEWMKETLIHLQERFFDDIALPGMIERGFQRAGFRKHSGNVLWAEFETQQSNVLRDVMRREALPIYEMLHIAEHGREDAEFHWEIMRAMYVAIVQLLIMRFERKKIENRFFIYNMLLPKQRPIKPTSGPLLVGCRQHWVLIDGTEDNPQKTLYKRPHLLHAIADWILLSFPNNIRLNFLMTRFRDEKMISPNDAIDINSAKIVANDNSSMGFFRE